VKGQFPDLVARPLLFIALFGGTYLLLDRHSSAPWAMAMRAAAALVVLGYGYYLLRQALPAEVGQAQPVVLVELDRSAHRVHLRVATPGF
jgi:thiol:disulfide interchange protein